jgi:TatD DNase family protein
MLIDTHAHLNDKAFYEKVPELVARAHEAGVEMIVNVGTNVPSSWRALELADQYEGMYAVVGLHPHKASEATPEMLDEFREMAALEKVVAIGEVGLDFYRDNSPRPQQKTVFADFVHLAADVGLPLVVHSREADQATLEILDGHLQPGQKLVMHCFGSDLNFARNCIERGALLGVAGTVTYPTAKALQAVVRDTGIERLVLETDCPYLSPQPKRGKGNNEPSNIPFMAAEVASLKGISVEEVAAATTANARAFYGI